jgi:hypothetical protein
VSLPVELSEKNNEQSILPLPDKVPPARQDIEFSNSEDFDDPADSQVRLTRFRSLARGDYKGEYPRTVET